MSVNSTVDVSQKAGLGKRAVALIIDTIVAGLLVGIVGGGITFALPMGPDGMGAAAVVTQAVGAMLYLGYFIVLEALYGQTLGKMALSIVVVSADGSAIGWGESLIRNLLRIVDQLPVLYIVGIIAVVLTDDEQRIGDLAASTLVVDS